MACAQAYKKSPEFIRDFFYIFSSELFNYKACLLCATFLIAIYAVGFLKVNLK